MHCHEDFGGGVEGGNRTGSKRILGTYTALSVIVNSWVRNRLETGWEVGDYEEFETVLVVVKQKQDSFRCSQ